MWNTTIFLFIIIFTLSVAFSEIFFAEFFLLMFSILNFSEYMSHPTAIVTTYDYFLGGYLYLLNAFYCIGAILMWGLNERKRKKDDKKKKENEGYED